LNPAKILLNSNGAGAMFVHWKRAPVQAFLSRFAFQKDTSSPVHARLAAPLLEIQRQQDRGGRRRHRLLAGRSGQALVIVPKIQGLHA
jgi:hypothetical protein